MKTTMTISVDGDVKEKAMHIVQNKMDTTISQYINKILIELINNQKIQKREP